jgi:hypothetical protein
VVNIICQSASPLCPNTVDSKQVGSMYRIAGCVAGATVGGTSTSGATAGTSGDGTVASPFGNLANDVAAWGTGSTGYGTCSSTSGGLNGARGVAADRYGNVYIADTGYIRKLFASGVPCATALNASGDGCPASQASWSGGSGLGVGLDPQGNLYITDTPTGSVTFAAGSTSLGTITLHADGVAALVTTSLPAGVDLVTATYNGTTILADPLPLSLSPLRGSSASTFRRCLSPANSMAPVCCLLRSR